MQGLRAHVRVQIIALAVLTFLALVGLSAASLPAAAQSSQPGVSTCPVLDLANPSPGDVVSPGAYVVQGIAFDPVTLSPSGVSRIELYLGTQDTGGLETKVSVPVFIGAAPSPTPR
jgi:hypothetical protein